MEPPPLSAAPVVQAAANINCHESLDSSPRSRHTESSEDNLAPQIPSGGGGKLRLMCSYGGHIMPRPHDKSLRYVGGETRMIVAERSSSLSELINRLSKTLIAGKSFSLKYQLPNEDLDSLISVTIDEDLENMIEEYDRINASAAGTASLKSSRLRLFLFPAKPDSSSSIGSLLENSVKSEGWFLDALNGTTRQFSESASVDCLLGLDEDIAAIVGNNDCSSAKDAQSRLKGVGGNSSKLGAHDFQSVPDSPMLETTSSFGSASSSPLLVNLPPIRVRPEEQEQKQQMNEIQDQFLQMNDVGVPMQKQEDGGNFMILPSPPMLTTPAAISLAPFPSPLPVTTFGASGDYLNKVLSDDERSELGARKPSQLQSQTPMPSPLPLIPNPSVVELASPDSVSSESNATNPLSGQRVMLYQDPAVQIQNPSLNNYRVPMNQVDQTMYELNSSYLVPTTQLDHHLQQQQQINPQQQQQINPQQQQQINTQQQQFIQSGTHYIHHQQPISPYYSIYPTQHQAALHHHPHQVIYVQARQPPAYNLPVHPSTYGDASASAGTVPSSRPQTQPPPPPQPVISGQQDMAATIYRAGEAGTAGVPPLLVQMGSSSQQPQYIGYSNIHHPSHSMSTGPTSSAKNGNYGYEYVEHHHPTHGQIFYTTQQLPPQQIVTAGQYQNIISSAPPPLPLTAAMPEAVTGSSQLLTGESMKQQIRTSQPL